MSILNGVLDPGEDVNENGILDIEPSMMMLAPTVMVPSSSNMLVRMPMALSQMASRMTANPTLSLRIMTSLIRSD